MKNIFCGEERRKNGPLKVSRVFLGRNAVPVDQHGNDVRPAYAGVANIGRHFARCAGTRSVLNHSEEEQAQGEHKEPTATTFHNTSVTSMLFSRKFTSVALISGYFHHPITCETRSRLFLLGKTRRNRPGFNRASHSCATGTRDPRSGHRIRLRALTQDGPGFRPAVGRHKPAASYCGFSFGSASGGLQMEKGPSLGLGLGSHCAAEGTDSMPVGPKAQSAATFKGFTAGVMAVFPICGNPFRGGNSRRGRPVARSILILRFPSCVFSV